MSWPQRIYVHGNCQAEALRGLLSEALPDSEINAIQAHQFTTAERLLHLERLASADVLVVMPVGPEVAGPEVSTAWMMAHCRTSARVVVYPSIFYRGDQPSTFAAPELETPLAPHVDALLIEAFLGGDPRPRMSEGFITAERRASLKELRARERSCGAIPVSRYIAANQEKGPLFHLFNHPNRKLLAWLAKRILRDLGLRGRVTAKGPDSLDFISMPLHFGDPVRVGGETVPAEEYWRPTQERLEALGGPAVRDIVDRNPELAAFLDRRRAWPELRAAA
jgi:hypothetical protein